MIEHIYDIFRNKKLTIKFITIGSIGFVCNYIILKTATDIWHINRIIAEVIAVLVALQVTFILHDKWTYRINHTVHKYNLTFKRRYRAYLMSNSFSALLTVVFFSIFSIFLDHLVSLVLAALIGLMWNYLVNKSVIWHHKPHNEKVEE